MRKSVTFICAALVCASMLAQTPDWVRSGDGWDATTYTLYVNSNPPANAYTDMDGVKHIARVVIGTGVTNIGSQAFVNNQDLQELVFAEGSNLDTIAMMAFETPGNGYLFRRLGKDDVQVNFYNQDAAKAPKKANANANANAFSNANAATNMTMIAKVDDGQWTKDNGRLMVYVGDELAAIAEPIAIANANAETEPLYFITIQSDRVGELRFEMDGQELTPTPMPIAYEADSHHGSLQAPVVLKADDNRPYKVLENNHVVIIRNNEKYDVTGKKL